MATKLVGSVELKRIHEFLSKALISSDLVNYSMLIDNGSDSESFKITLSELLSFTTGGSSLPIVKVSDKDTTAGYLYEKISVGGDIVKTIVNSGGNETLELSVNSSASQWIDIANGISYPNNGVLIGTSIGSDLLYKLQVEGGNVGFRNPSGIDRFAFLGHLNDTQDAILAMYDNTDAQKVRINTNGDSYFNGGSFGIGTSTPEYKLSIEGTELTYASVINTVGDTRLLLGAETNTNSIISKKSTDNTGQPLGFYVGTTRGLHIGTDGHVNITRLGMSGDYDSTQVQGIWTIGEDYKIDPVANDFGSAYGMVYSYQSLGGAFFSNQHQISFVTSGVIAAGISMSTGDARFNNVTATDFIIL